MSYYLAIPDGDKYIVLGEEFAVRSNADKYAKRMKWTRYFIATAEQKAMIESGQPVSFGVANVVENVTTLIYPEKEVAETPPPKRGRWGKNRVSR